MAELAHIEKKRLAAKAAIALVRQCRDDFKGELTQLDRPGKSFNAIGFASKHADGWLVVDYENGGTDEGAKELIEIFQQPPGPYPKKIRD